jgi:hypothetical protein
VPRIETHKKLTEEPADKNRLIIVVKKTLDFQRKRIISSPSLQTSEKNISILPAAEVLDLIVLLDIDEGREERRRGRRRRTSTHFSVDVDHAFRKFPRDLVGEFNA